MIEDIKTRIEALKAQIEQADDDTLAELLEHLEQAVMQLEAKGISAPPWARQRLSDRIDEDVEGQFDNMPV